MVRPGQVKLFFIKKKQILNKFRWNYTDPLAPEAPDYSLYTGLSAKMTLMAFFLLLGLHTLMVALVKLSTSEEFRSRDGNCFKKLIHVIANINIPIPFRDWDAGDFSVEEHRRRRWNTEVEMGCLFIVNAVFSMALLAPVWYTGQYS